MRVRLQFGRNGWTVDIPGARVRPGPLAAPGQRAWPLRFLLWLATCAALVLLGQWLAPRAIDFVVYHRAAQSLLAGRSDLYASGFALDPPMRYVYPPLFIVLVAPLGWLDLASAHGVWFALLALSLGAVVRRAYRRFRPTDDRLYLPTLLLLAGPWVVYGLHSSNVHLLVVLMLGAAALAWADGRRTRAALLIALGGALKVFPLFLLAPLALLREWRIVGRVALVSALLWLAPVTVFGPLQTAELYVQWWRDVAGNVERLRRESRLDISLASASERWLSTCDYTGRIDARFPQVNVAHLPARAARRVGQLASALVLAAALLACWRLRRLAGSQGVRRHGIVAAVLALLVTTQLLLGPYTTLLYLSGWLLVALTLPWAAAGSGVRASRGLLLLGLVNTALAAVPGATAHRALEAAGAYTLLGLVLWLLSLSVAWRLGADA